MLCGPFKPSFWLEWANGSRSATFRLSRPPRKGTGLSGRQAQAVATAEKTIAQAPDMAADRRQKFEQDLAVPNANRGKAKLALAHLESMVAGRGSGDPAADAELELVAAKVYLAAGDAQEARDAAMKAKPYFASKELPDSTFRSALLCATASKDLGDAVGCRTFSTKAIDILSNLQHTWDAQIYQTYISRLDIQPMARELNHPPKWGATHEAFSPGSRDSLLAAWGSNCFPVLLGEARQKPRYRKRLAGNRAGWVSRGAFPKLLVDAGRESERLYNVFW